MKNVQSDAGKTKFKTWLCDPISLQVCFHHLPMLVSQCICAYAGSKKRAQRKKKQMAEKQRERNGLQLQF